MIFSKKIWTPNDALTVSDFNRIESGIEEAFLEAKKKENSKYVQSGKYYFDEISKDTVKSVHIAFDKAFSSIPYVVVSPQTSGAGVVFATVGSPTKSGFDIYIKRNDSVNNLTVHWIAAGEI